MPVPTVLCPKVKTGVPARLTTSPVSTPLKDAVPVAVAAVVPSYSLLAPVRPVIVNAFAVMSALKLGCVKV